MTKETSPPMRLVIGKASVSALVQALHARHLDTRQHCDRVVRLSLALGRRCALKSDELFALECGALLHDIGKIGIPDRILDFPGPLCDEDRAAMQTHSEIGDAIIGATGLAELAPIGRIVRHHHENFDGSGYPDGLSGEAVPPLARMVHLADAYDAMVSDRAYRAGMEHARAIDLLNEESGTRSDPWLLARFTELFETDPSLAEPGLEAWRWLPGR